MRAACTGMLLCACTGSTALGPGPAVPPAPSTSEVVYVSCMAPPPPMDPIDWPDADSIGNVLMHTSQVDHVKGAYANLRRYVDEQYFGCLRVAEQRSETSVTVERDP